MYKLVLILKYLRRKFAPLFAALAVTLCTMMVIIVISVMGGFLDLLEESVHSLSGDVTITSQSLTGFPHYERLIEELEAKPAIAAATPVIESYGLVHFPGATRRTGKTQPVQVFGVRPREYDRVTTYRSALHWQTSNPGQPDTYIPNYPQSLPSLEALGLALDPPAGWQPPDEAARPGAVVGIELNPNHQRGERGQYDAAYASMALPVVLTVMPLTETGNFAELGPERRTVIVVNEFKSGAYEIDSRRVFVPFEALQRWLYMHEEEYRPDDGPNEGEWLTEPARATQVLMTGADNVSLEEIHEAANEAVQSVLDAHPDMPGIWAETWRQQHSHILGAVQNEVGLVTFLFAIISLVAVVMVATTFYMIVLEKTRDIGVLRAVGASRRGIMSLFLGYGLVIGTIGAALGLALAWAIVTHLNEIQFLLAHRLGTLLSWAGIVLVAAILGTIIAALIGRRRDATFEWGLAGLLLATTAAVVCSYFLFNDITQGPIATFNANYGWQMWNPQTYYFDRIPDQIDPAQAIFIAIAAVISSVVGALIPALLAARLDPVEALRYE